MNRQRAKEHWRAAALVTLLSIILGFILNSLTMVENLQYKAVNTLFNLRGKVTPPDTSIVLVTIDDQTLASLPAKLPYPRSYYVT
ncbi:MAG TPA: CHASE2 domain-containing protein, partial [bacterium]|nr:CHASE2 domain-containing protein [bacterium]